MSHPDNFRQPRWHVRDYGLMLANPFALKAFNAGQSVHLISVFLTFPNIASKTLPHRYQICTSAPCLKSRRPLLAAGQAYCLPSICYCDRNC